LTVKGALRINRKLGLIPVVAVVLALALLLGLGLKGHYVFNPPYLLLTLSVVFYFLVTPIVTYISAKAYLTTGSLTLLFVSLAFLVGIPFSIAGAIASSVPNQSVKVAALGLVVSSFFQFSASLQASFGSVPIGPENRRLRLPVSFIAVLALSVIIIILAFTGVFPVFFVQNAGVTFIDEVFYGAIIFFFLVGSLLYLRIYLKSESSTLYVYSLGLLLYAIGSFGMSQQVVFGDAVVWVGRVSTYIGLLYFLYALIGSRNR
jgi:hypothetical protein